MSKIEKIKSDKSFTEFAKNACKDTKEDIKLARESGDKFARDFVKPLKTYKVFDSLVSNSASLMGQMVAGGVTLLMCPMKSISKELSKDNS